VRASPVAVHAVPMPVAWYDRAPMTAPETERALNPAKEGGIVLTAGVRELVTERRAAW